MEDYSTAVVVSLKPGPTELLKLCSSLGLEVVETIVQKLDRPDPRGFVGPGKLKEIGEYVREQKVDVVVFNGELSPSTMFNVEMSLRTPVYDRVRLILEIFRRQAASEEARLQVEMAVLTQELPVLREWVHRAKVGEHPGLMAGGEYDVRQYYTAQTRRKKDLSRRLSKLVANREIQRANRLKQGLRTVSLAGYTNAGKTALMNALTEVGRPSEGRLFTTLSTTTRRVKGLPFPVLMTDTIGFMEDLPPWLLESFRSTLEEVLHSDVMLLVLDASDSAPEMVRKLRASAKAIWTIGATATIQPVFNKMDLIDLPGGAIDGENARRFLSGKLEECLSIIGDDVGEARMYGEGGVDTEKVADDVMADDVVADDVVADDVMADDVVADDVVADDVVADDVVADDVVADDVVADDVVADDVVADDVVADDVVADDVVADDVVADDVVADDVVADDVVADDEPWRPETWPPKVADRAASTAGSHTARSLIVEMLRLMKRNGEGVGQMEAEGSPSMQMPVPVSAKDEDNLPALLKSIGEATSPERVLVGILDRSWRWQGMLSHLHDRDDVMVVNVSEGDDEIRVHMRCEDAGLARAKKALRERYGEDMRIEDPMEGEVPRRET